MKRKVKRSTKQTVKRPARRGPRRLAAATAGRRQIGGGTQDDHSSDGDAAVRAYIASLPAWQREISNCFDDLVTRKVSKVRRVIKWGLPFYGVPGRGWFVSCGGFATAVKITFFQGVSLRPVPPSGNGKQLRSIDLRSRGELDAAPIASWVRQAAALPGFGS